jgi:hypothetical protein
MRTKKHGGNCVPAVLGRLGEESYLPTDVTAGFESTVRAVAE